MKIYIKIKKTDKILIQSELEDKFTIFMNLMMEVRSDISKEMLKFHKKV